MITANAKRFIELQTQVNNQIDQKGIADATLVNELDQLGDQLTMSEITMVNTYRNENPETHRGEDMEFEDIEWMIG